MNARSITAERVLTTTIAAELLLLSATLAIGVAIDFASRSLVPEGVVVVGRELSNLTQEQAATQIQESVAAPLLTPITVTGDNKTWTLDPKGIVTVDTDGMLTEAYATKRSAPIIARLQSQLKGRPLPTVIEPSYSVDTTALAAWVASISAGVDRKPVNAVRTVAPKYKIRITPSVQGARVDQAAAVAEITKALSAEAALSGGQRTVALPVKLTKPKVTESNFKTAIVVSLSRCKIYLYHGDQLVKTWPCAPGRPGFPTPTGDFKVNSRQRYAPWINPGSAWAASMPAVIPAGPNNPMGVTKTGIDYPGVFMHGIPPGEFGSIGTHASHGCMRMFPKDALDVYNNVRIGDPVFIRP